MDTVLAWIKSPWVLLGAAVGLGFALTQLAGGPTPVAEAEAYFLKGTYSTDDGCDVLEKNEKAKGLPLVGEDQPITIDRHGIFGLEWSCEYARIDRVARRKTYVATLYCLDTGESSIDHMSMVMNKDKTLMAKRSGDKEPVTYRRCKIKN